MKAYMSDQKRRNAWAVTFAVGPAGQPPLDTVALDEARTILAETEPVTDWTGHFTPDGILWKRPPMLALTDSLSRFLAS